jgi:acetyl esterase/lipase
MTTTSGEPAAAASGRGPAADPAGGPPPPLDPELEAGLAEIPPISSGEMTMDAIPEGRQVIAQFSQFSDDILQRDGAYEVSTRLVPGPAGAPDIELLICLPVRTVGSAQRDGSAGGTGVTAPVPAIYHIHGGGMVLGDNRTGVTGMLELAAPHQMAVVSVEYRLAPETPHPGPVEDCYAGLTWMADHAAELGIDPARIIVGGASAGGGLSAAVALLARDRIAQNGSGPVLAGQLLLCPMLDDRNDTPSARQMTAGPWNRAANALGWTALLGEAQGGPDVSPYAAPARATDLSGLPPAFIDVGSAETFRDEAVAYASRLWQAGGSAELHVWPGGFHAFASLLPAASISKDSAEAPARWLRRLLATLPG